MCLDCKMKDDGLILHVEIYEIPRIKDYLYFFHFFYSINPHKWRRGTYEVEVLKSFLNISRTIILN